MIPCYMCGKDIGGGWYIGYPPAPDSQKMGLCKEHDLASNRQRVQKAWRELIHLKLEEEAQKSAHRAGAAIRLLSIYFTGGGSISLPCSAFELMDEKTLKVTTPAGEKIFFPLGQVRNYALSPIDLPDATVDIETQAAGSKNALPEKKRPAALTGNPEKRS